ncbi:cyclin-dependent protein serine/threonine kinase activity [Bonamia ostreae]|uniref:Cyclin-dependent kinase 2 homolog n=1 Tax=Bonamia ostreae TaxID=126728 RepID=A0ABV2AH66_9EUKA
MEHSLEATSFSRPNKERWLGDHDINTFKQEIKSSRRIKKIGEGTYGAVFKTESPTGMNVALKKINLENEHEGFPITALREIKMLKAIRHPNIISLLDVIPVHTGGRRPDFHLIFEYLDHDLAGLMASGEVVLQEQHVKHCLYELLRGLEYLHNRCKLIHRDVKLSNILVGKDGSIKIADFGLARQHYSDKRDYTGRVVTLWYRAPELLLGIKNYSTAIDIWAAGCVFSEIVFGKPAFPGETEIQQLTLICKVLFE